MELLAMIVLDHFIVNVHLVKQDSFVILRMHVHQIHVMKEHYVKQVQLMVVIFAHALVDLKEQIVQLILMNVLRARLVSIMGFVSILQEVIDVNVLKDLQGQDVKLTSMNVNQILVEI